MSRSTSAATQMVQHPWFVRRPRWAIAVASALFVAIFTLRVQIGDERDAISLLYVLPVSLIAIGFGRRPGVIAASVAIGLLATWTLLSDVSLTPLGWLSRIVPLSLIGVLIGSAADRMRAAEVAERRAEALALLQLNGAEINDSIVQSLAVAKWAIESGDAERARAILDDTIVTGQRLVTEVLGSNSIAQQQLRRPQT